MDYKIVLFDIDGVLIRPPYYFGTQLEKEGFRNAEKELNNFFVSRNPDFTEGRGNIESEIIPILESIGWEKEVGKFFEEQYKFESQFYDPTFDKIVADLKRLGFLCFLASSQEKVRSMYFWEDFGLNKIFDGKYISCDIGARKEKDEYWEKVLKYLEENQKIKSSEILFFDDSRKVIESAQRNGVNSFLFTNVKQLKEDLEKLGINI